MSMKRHLRAPAFLLPALLIAVACNDSPGEPGATELPPAGNASLGGTAFVESCAECHSSRDALDLAFFSFPDSTIIRRAVFHVDSATARNIAAHVRTLPVAGVARGTRMFQPGDRILPDDVSFAIGVFGRDAWPASLTTTDLLAIDPLDVPVAVAMPKWSDEGTNLDWLPDRPLPESVLDRDGGRAGRSLAAYYATPGLDHAIDATRQLRRGVRETDDVGVCQRIPGGAFTDPVGCFEARRWVASFAGQHMLRADLDRFVHREIHDSWWDVGNVARRASRRAGLIENREENWASWMYLGWMFDPGRHASVYTGRGLTNFALDRHATFVALRSQVARPPLSAAVYADVDHAADFAPPHWTFDVVRFGFEHILERLDAGLVPLRDDQIDQARFHIDRAVERASRKINGAELATLAALRDEISARLP